MTRRLQAKSLDKSKLLAENTKMRKLYLNDKEGAKMVIRKISFDPPLDKNSLDVRSFDELRS